MRYLFAAVLCLTLLSQQALAACAPDDKPCAIRTHQEQERALCEKTGGKFLTLEDCAPCPPRAVCEQCLTGCQCADGAVFVEDEGCAALKKE